jgi:hypothetical protein
MATLPRLCEDYSLLVAATGHAVQIVIGSVATCAIAGDADLSRKAQRNCYVRWWDSCCMRLAWRLPASGTA